MKRILNSILIFSIIFSLSACEKTEQKMPLSENMDVSERKSMEIVEATGNNNMLDGSKADTENKNRIPNSIKNRAEEVVLHDLIYSL